VSDRSDLLLRHHLKTLKPPTMLREYERAAIVCTEKKASCATHIERVAELEVIERERKSAARRVKAAGFPVVKTIDTFEFGAQPSINRVLVQELLTGEHLAKRECVLCMGDSGTGKTHLALALGFAACGQGRRVRFFTVSSLVTQLLERREERMLGRFLKQLERLDLLILDELGYVPFTKSGAELLFDVVSRAYEHAIEANGESYRLRDAKKRLGKRA
jgi:DNA replication protein DnaC